MIYWEILPVALCLTGRAAEIGITWCKQTAFHFHYVLPSPSSITPLLHYTSILSARQAVSVILGC